jgi:hypothetical protein
MRKIILFLIALASLTMAGNNAHARLGWTLDQCRVKWGEPVTSGYNQFVGQTGYIFRISPGLLAQVYLLDGKVESIEYCTKDKQSLEAHIDEILRKNNSGAWKRYIDAGTNTLQTWNVLDEAGGLIAYAMLYEKQDDGFYHFQVSSRSWSDTLEQFYQTHPTKNS